MRKNQRRVLLCFSVSLSCFGLRHNLTNGRQQLWSELLFISYIPLEQSKERLLHLANHLSQDPHTACPLLPS